MSQIDKLTYLPVLFWFLLFFLSFYFAVYSFFVPLVVSMAKAREKEYGLVASWATSFFSFVVSLQPFLSAASKFPRFLSFSSALLLKLLSSYA